MKYYISVPDANKPSIKISNVKLTKNPFDVLGVVDLKSTFTNGGLKQYEVVYSDFESCFPLGENFWSITDMFCNACNSNIKSYYGSNAHDFNLLVHKSNFPIFSKHKVTNGWKVIIYNPDMTLLDDYIDELIYSQKSKLYFEI